MTTEDFKRHPICKSYEANCFGVIRNIFSKNTVGYREKNGYEWFGCSSCCKVGEKNKKYLKHRFMWECFNGIIKDKLVVDHKNNIKIDNRLENLQLLTNKQNTKKDVKPRRCEPPIAVKAINLETGEIFNYKSINKAGKDLFIDSARICGILSGLNKTTLSRKLNQRFTFEKLSEHKPQIIAKKNIYIKAKIVKINRC